MIVSVYMGGLWGGFIGENFVRYLSVFYDKNVCFL